MVGALARVMCNPEGLTPRAAEAMRKLGLTLPSGNPMDNNKAQAVELVQDVEYSLGIVERLLRDGLAAGAARRRCARGRASGRPLPRPPEGC